MNDREKIRTVLDIFLQYGFDWVESEKTITVIRGPKFMFLDDGTIRSVIKGGEGWGPDGLKYRMTPARSEEAS